MNAAGIVPTLLLSDANLTFKLHLIVLIVLIVLTMLIITLFFIFSTPNVTIYLTIHIFPAQLTVHLAEKFSIHSLKFYLDKNKY